MLSIISPVVSLRGIKLCRTSLTNKDKSNKSRKKMQQAGNWTLALVHYLQLEKRSLPSHPSQVATRQVTSFLCLGLCFLSSWPQHGLVCVLCFHISHSDCSGCKPSKDSCKFKPEVIPKPIYLCLSQALSVPSLQEAQHCQMEGER